MLLTEIVEKFGYHVIVRTPTFCRDREGNEIWTGKYLDREIIGQDARGDWVALAPEGGLRLGYIGVTPFTMGPINPITMINCSQTAFGDWTPMALSVCRRCNGVARPIHENACRACDGGGYEYVRRA